MADAAAFRDAHRATAGKLHQCKLVRKYVVPRVFANGKGGVFLGIHIANGRNLGNVRACRPQHHTRGMSGIKEGRHRGGGAI